MAAAGFTQADFDTDLFEVWPCCWGSAVFMANMGHGAWDHGMNGPCRLDYAVVQNVLFDHHQIKKKQRRQLFADLQHMEIPALNAMHTK